MTRSLILFLTAAALQAADIEDAIHRMGPPESAEQWGELATLYLRDQDHQRALETLIEALENRYSKTYVRSDSEEELYLAAYAIYLDPSLSKHEAAQRILHLYDDADPNFADLGYVLAAAEANLGRYESFFSLFFRSFDRNPDHYLAAKAGAAAAIKVYERTLNPVMFNKAYQFAEQAAEKEPCDPLVYRMLVDFAPRELKKESVRQALNKIVRENMIIARGDISFYVEAALQTGQAELAKKFVAQAKTWYVSSRAIERAQDMIRRSP